MMWQTFIDFKHISCDMNVLLLLMVSGDGMVCFRCGRGLEYLTKGLVTSKGSGCHYEMMNFAKIDSLN